MCNLIKLRAVYVESKFQKLKICSCLFFAKCKLLGKKDAEKFNIRLQVLSS